MPCCVIFHTPRIVYLHNRAFGEAQEEALPQFIETGGLYVKI